jgi:hypothetical protein
MDSGTENSPTADLLRMQVRRAEAQRLGVWRDKDFGSDRGLGLGGSRDLPLRMRLYRWAWDCRGEARGLSLGCGCC